MADTHNTAGWQPIGTAPRDGAVLVWDGVHRNIAGWSYSFRDDSGGVSDFWRENADPSKYSVPLADVGRWYALVNGEAADDGSHDHDLVHLVPTHWMPLPEPPHAE